MRALAVLAVLLVATTAPAAAESPFIVYQCGQDSANLCRVQPGEPGDGFESDAVAFALATAADMLQVPADQLTVVTVEAREWSDTSLGCAAPEQAYLEIIVSGYLVVVASANGQELQIHTDQGQFAVSC